VVAVSFILAEDVIATVLEAFEMRDSIPGST
jgi:hypothetical protein